jgi:hypothetical protein
MKRRFAGLLTVPPGPLEVAPAELAELPLLAGWSWSTLLLIVRRRRRQRRPRRERLREAALRTLGHRRGGGTRRDVPEREARNASAKLPLEFLLRLAEEIERRLTCSRDAIELGEDDLDLATRAHHVGVEQALQDVGRVGLRARSMCGVGKALAVDEHDDGVCAPQEREPLRVLLRVLGHAKQLPRHRREENVAASSDGLSASQREVVVLRLLSQPRSLRVRLNATRCKPVQVADFLEAEERPRPSELEASERPLVQALVD